MVKFDLFAARPPEREPTPTQADRNAPFGTKETERYMSSMKAGAVCGMPVHVRHKDCVAGIGGVPRCCRHQACPRAMLRR